MCHSQIRLELGSIDQASSPLSPPLFVTAATAAASAVPLAAPLAAYGPSHQHQKRSCRGWNLWPHRPCCLPYRDCECDVYMQAQREALSCPSMSSSSIELHCWYFRSPCPFARDVLWRPALPASMLSNAPCRAAFPAAGSLQPGPSRNTAVTHGPLSPMLCAPPCRSPCKTGPLGRPPPEGSARGACGRMWTLRRAASSSDAPT